MRFDADKHLDQGALDKSRLDLYCSRQLRLRETMRRLDVPALLILDPIDIFYATGARNMLFFSMRTPARYLLLFAEGPAFLYEYFGCEHLAADLPTIDHIVPAEGLMPHQFWGRCARRKQAICITDSRCRWIH